MLSLLVLELSEKLAELLPEGLKRSLSLRTGSDANKAAIKLAKFFTEKFELVVLSLMWHGMTGAFNASTYQDRRKNHGSMMPGFGGTFF